MHKVNAADTNTLRAFLKERKRSFNPRSYYYIETDNGSIVGHAQVEPRVLNLHDKAIKVSYIVDSSLSENQLSKILDELSHEEIITVMKSDQPDAYEALGFETVIDHYNYNINASSLPDFSVEGIVIDPSPEDLVSVYKRFTQHFTANFDRDTTYYKELKQHYSVIGIMEDDELVAYACYSQRESSVHVHECCYVKSGHIFRLLSFVSRGKNRIILTSSIYENMHRLFPDARKEKHGFLIARMNDKELFERLFHIKIISAYSGFNAFGKPLWNWDFY